MFREEMYCDRCGAKMTYVDADGDENINGIVANAKLSFTVTRKESYGSSGENISLEGVHFCSTKCVLDAIAECVHQLARSNVNPLPERA